MVYLWITIKTHQYELVLLKILKRLKEKHKYNYCG